MENIEIDETAKHCRIITGKKWNERTIQPSDGNQHCYYCNYSLKCRQQDCIWRENCA